MRLSDRVQSHRNEILALAEKHGATNVRIFGSVARGQDSETSDLDLLVNLGSHRTPFFPGGLMADLERLLSCQIDIVTEGALHSMIRDRILAEAIPL